MEKLLALSNEHELLSKQDFKVDFIQSDKVQFGEKGTCTLWDEAMIPTGTCDLRVGDNWVKCVVDSGTSCTVLRSDALDAKEYQSMLQDSQNK